MSDNLSQLEIAENKAVLKSGIKRAKFAFSDREQLKGIEQLVICPEAEVFSGLNFFDDIRIVRYEGENDIFGWEDAVSWLVGGENDDDDKFLQRVFTNQVAFRPISEKLIAISVPNMPPIHIYNRYSEIFDRIFSLLCPEEGRGFYRQDDSRQNAVLCNCYSQMKRLEWAFYMGFGIDCEKFPEKTAAFYKKEQNLTPREQVLYALALMQGVSYREFYLSTGEHSCTIMADKQSYMHYLEKAVILKDNQSFKSDLRSLLKNEILHDENLRAMVDMALENRLTESAAIALNATENKTAASFEDEFAL